MAFMALGADILTQYMARNESEVLGLVMTNKRLLFTGRYSYAVHGYKRERGAGVGSGT